MLFTAVKCWVMEGQTAPLAFLKKVGFSDADLAPLAKGEAVTKIAEKAAHRGLRTRGR